MRNRLCLVSRGILPVSGATEGEATSYTRIFFFLLLFDLYSITQIISTLMTQRGKRHAKRRTTHHAHDHCRVSAKMTWTCRRPNRGDVRREA